MLVTIQFKIFIFHLHSKNLKIKIILAFVLYECETWKLTLGQWFAKWVGGGRGFL
jgi:hypothetical protein